MSLTKLCGPAHGVLELPITVQWGPTRHFDLSDTGQRRMAYRALVRDGSLKFKKPCSTERCSCRNGVN